MIVHLVTDRIRLAPGAAPADRGRCLLEQIEFAVAARVDVIQVRERDLEARELCMLVTEIMRLARGTGSRVVVNDRLDLALAAGADGVHLRADSIPLRAVRAIAPRGFLVGRSIHRVEDVAADDAGADYLCAGTVWRTASKPDGHPLLGVDGLRAVVKAAPAPVIAIGGIAAARAAEVAAAGAAGVAAIGLFQNGAGERCRAGPLIDVMATLRRSFDTPRSGS